MRVVITSAFMAYFLGLASMVSGLAMGGANAQASEPPEAPPGSLKGGPVPPVVERISGLSLVPHFVRDGAAAIRLGKALFWDQQAGSDGQACASCHFHAFAHNRVKNQLSRGLIGGNGVFDPTGFGGAGGPNYTLVADDFPFHRLTDPNDRDSEVEFDTDDVASSQGVFPTIFVDIIPGRAKEIGEVIPVDPVGFHVGGVNVRRVEPRNTPTVINAVFNLRNYWDGRANNIFNGVDTFGRRNQDARILEKLPDGRVESVAVEFTDASLASQAVGPPGDDFEMSFAGRTFPKIGKKLLSLRRLGLQEVDPSDSVLGALANQDGNGLTTIYAELIEAAFASRL